MYDYHLQMHMLLGREIIKHNNIAFEHSFIYFKALISPQKTKFNLRVSDLHKQICRCYSKRRNLNGGQTGNN